jgi:fructose-specific phosphotransferase system IIC component
MDLQHFFSSPLFVGAAGAFVSLRFSRDVTWIGRAMTFVCGALIAAYCARPLGNWLKLTTENDVLGVAFAIGLLGLSVLAAVFRGVTDIKVADIVTSWTTRR